MNLVKKVLSNPTLHEVLQYLLIFYDVRKVNELLILIIKVHHKRMAKDLIILSNSSELVLPHEGAKLHFDLVTNKLR